MERDHAIWKQIGTEVHVLVTRPEALDVAVRAVRSTVDLVDATYSRFRPDSELSRLNAAAGAPVPVSPLLFEAIETAIRVARVTDGAVDPTIGEVIRALGYDRDFAALPADAPAPRLVIQRVPGWMAVELDQTGRTVRFPARLSLDLGSTGKALAADRAAAAAHGATGAGVLVSLGGDIATAGDPPEGGWRVTCADDSRADPAGEGEVIAIRTDAIATSSTSVRRWTSGGVVRHHIVDPWTGLPAEGPWRTVTVVAGTCVDANAASTAAVVFGDHAIAWLRRTGLPARLVARDGTVVRLGAWPAPDAPPGVPTPSRPASDDPAMVPGIA